MTADQQAAIARLRQALEGYPRGTKYERPGRVRGTASGGKLVTVAAPDLQAATQLAAPPAGCRKAAELAEGVGNLLAIHASTGQANPPRVTLLADDLFELLDQVPAVQTSAPAE
jgi:hypothetical protein